MASRNPNPLVKLAMAGASIAAGIAGKKALSVLWERVFHEQVPEESEMKKEEKNLKKRRKAARKDGRSRADVESMKGAYDDVPAWRVALWTILSGTLIVGLQQLAREGARKGASSLTRRRPRPNRG